MKKFNMKFVFNQGLYLLIQLLLWVIYIGSKHFIVLILLILYQCFLVKKSWQIWFISLCLCILYMLNAQLQYHHLVLKTPIAKTCTIVTIPEMKGNKYQFYCQKGISKYLVKSNNATIEIGDIISIKEEGNPVKTNTVPYLFNYQHYLLSKNVYYVFDSDEIKVVGHANWPHFKMINHVLKRYDGQLKRYQQALLIGVKTFDEEYLDNMQMLNISHLFVVSGFHVVMLAKLIRTGLRTFKVTKETSEIVIIIVLTIYLMLNNFQISIFRAYLLYVGTLFKKRLYPSLDQTHLLAIICILNLLVKPFVIYDTGFQLSYLITFILIIGQAITSKYNNNALLNILTVTILAQSFSLPIVANFNFSFNLISFVFSLILLPYFSYLIFPLTIMSLFVPLLVPIISPVFILYEKLIHNLADIKLFTINVGAFTLTRTIIYYLLLYMLLLRLEKGKTIRVPLMSLGCIVLFYHSLNPNTIVSFIDVGQGDSGFIRTPFNACTMLIDTGGASYLGTFHPGERNVVPFLKAQQIKKLDYFVISHGDQDHAGDYYYVLEHLDVKTIVFSIYDDSTLKKEIIQQAKIRGIKILELKSGDQFSCGKILVNVYAPIKSAQDLNNNSLVLGFRIQNDYYLFTGDISEETEREILAKYPNLNATIIKLSHHGAKTGNSELWLSKINPEIGIISVGRNHYGHPHEDVLKRLDRHKISYYTTIEDGTIQIKYLAKKRFIKHTC